MLKPSPLADWWVADTCPKIAAAALVEREARRGGPRLFLSMNLNSNCQPFDIVAYLSIIVQYEQTGPQGTRRHHPGASRGQQPSLDHPDNWSFHQHGHQAARRPRARVHRVPDADAR